MTSVAPAPSSRPRLCALDGVRLLAALGVALSHFVYGTRLIRTEPLDGVMVYVSKVSEYGGYGVDLFFVISGFVILMSAWGTSIPAFVASRVARIYPLFWLSLGLTMVFIWLRWFPAEMTWPTAVANSTLFHSIFGIPNGQDIYWTLFAELRFYLMIAVFMIVGITPARVLALAFIWPIVAQICWLGKFDSLGLLLNSDFAPHFAGGMVLYLMYRYKATVAHYLVLGVNVVFAVNSRLAPLKERPDSVRVYTFIVIVACFALVWFCTQTRMTKMSSRWLVLAGAISYPVYLFHYLFGRMVMFRGIESDLPFGLVVLTALVVTLVTSWIIYQYVDKKVSPRFRRSLRSALESIPHGMDGRAQRTPQDPSRPQQDLASQPSSSRRAEGGSSVPSSGQSLRDVDDCPRGDTAVQVIDRLSPSQPSS